MKRPLAKPIMENFKCPYNMQTLAKHDHFEYRPGPHLNIKTAFRGMDIYVMKIRRWCDHLIFMMGIPILVRWYLTHDKMQSLQCMGSNFCVKLQTATFEISTKFWTHTRKNMHLLTFTFMCDLQNIWIMTPWAIVRRSLYTLKLHFGGYNSLLRSTTCHLELLVFIFNFKKNMYNFAVCSMPADSLTPARC